MNCNHKKRAIVDCSLLAFVANETEWDLLMQSFYSKPLPVPTVNSSGIVCILNDRRVFFYTCPRDDRLNHDYFVTLLSCLSANHLAQLFQAILSSKRLLLFSNSLSKLTKCCLALSQLIYPFTWPYSFVSLMPSSWLDDLLDAPCPFIYGCLDETRQALPMTIDHDTLQIDLDRDKVEGSMDQIDELPANLRQTLESSLTYLTRFRLTKADRNLINIAVSEACLHVLTELFHRLPDYYQRKKASCEKEKHFSICSDYFEYHDNGIDFQSLSSGEQDQSTLETKKEQENDRFDYDFHAGGFLSDPSTSLYTLFLKDFTQGLFTSHADTQREGRLSIFRNDLLEVLGWLSTNGRCRSVLSTSQWTTTNDRRWTACQSRDTLSTDLRYPRETSQASSKTGESIIFQIEKKTFCRIGEQKKEKLLLFPYWNKWSNSVRCQQACTWGRYCNMCAQKKH